MENTKIELEYPYSEDYKSGYLNTNKEPRRTLLLVRNDGTQTSTAYARYLMSIHLGRYLEKYEQVDHKDDNKLNDVIDNLQILSQKENNEKRDLFHGIKLAEDIELECPICKINFKRPSRNIKHKLQKGKEPCCSRKCGGIYSHRK